MVDEGLSFVLDKVDSHWNKDAQEGIPLLFGRGGLHIFLVQKELHQDCKWDGEIG